MNNHIKDLRKAAKLSQKDLARLCNVTIATISRVENGSRNPSLQLAFDIAYWLCKDVNVNITDVFDLHASFYY